MIIFFFFSGSCVSFWPIEQGNANLKFDSGEGERDVIGLNQISQTENFLFRLLRLFLSNGMRWYCQ